MSRVGISECRIGPDGVIEKKHPRTEFNFSAITKGYGCDAVGKCCAATAARIFLYGDRRKYVCRASLRGAGRGM